MNCDDNKIPADKSEFVSGNSKSSPHPLPDEAILHTHNQQTTHQITTVTKFIHEVKHINPDGSSIDDIASPTDRKYSKSDNTTICYSTMPMENNRCQHLGYSETETPQSLNQCHSLCVADDSNLLARHCPTGAEYHNPLINHKNAMIVQSQGSYNCDDLMGAYHGRNEQCVSSSTLSQKVAASSFMPADAVQSADYLPRPQYDEMPNYIVTSSLNEAGHEAYTEDPSMLYGYISETNYAVPRSAVPVNLNSYTTLPLSFEVNINASEAELQKEKEHRIYDNSADIRNPMAHLSLHPHMGASQMLDPKDGYIRDVTNDAAATMRWRAPNLSEVISFLNNPSSTIKANAAAYLQHLCYMDDPNKQRTRTLGGIPPLVRLLSSDVYEVYKNACGALRNLSYGRQNDENKRAIKNAGGIAALINLLCRVKEVEVKELVTGVIWNMSSCEDLKRFIIDDGLSALVIKVIKPNSGWDPVCPGETCTSTVFRNASGVLRNVSSAGEYARTKLRNCDYLVECLLYVVRTSIEKNNIGTKIVENCVCILRNLSYRCQEVEDPNYDKVAIPPTTLSSSKSENLGCFGSSKRKKEQALCESKESLSNSSVTSLNSLPKNLSTKGYEQLWQSDVVHYYLALLQSCSNPETLEAAAGAIQNLSACYWQPSIDIRAAVRKEKGLPILVELLRMEVDRVVCAVATALRNLAIDQRNKELIGKYAMRDLIQKLPSGIPQHDMGTSDETIAAVLATINEVIKKNPEFARTLLDSDGVERLLNISKQRMRYTPCVLKFSDQVLFTMWQHNELRDVFKKHGWKEQDFITKTIAARMTASNSPNNANNTLNRPMASQSRTRYEDKTMHTRARYNADNNTASRNNGKIPNSNDSTTLYQRINTDDVVVGTGTLESPTQM